MCLQQRHASNYILVSLKLLQLQKPILKNVMCKYQFLLKLHKIDIEIKSNITSRLK
jgi:hypothetical protein